MFAFKHNTSDLLLVTTSIIVGRDKAGDVSYGTAFFFSADEGHPLFLVTNLHVIEDMVTGEFPVHLHEDGQPNVPSLRSVTIRPPNFRRWWVRHPNSNIDLAAAPVEAMCKAAGVDIETTATCVFSASHIPTEDELESYSAIEDVAMIGYPAAFWDEVNNLPVIQRGSTASHPGIPFRGEPHGVVDLPCVLGSSGSPIISHGEGGIVRANHPSAKVRQKQLLLGVLSDAITMTLQGEVKISAVPTTKGEMVTEISTPIHLGRYIKSREILPLIDHAAKRPTL